MPKEKAHTIFVSILNPPDHSSVTELCVNLHMFRPVSFPTVGLPSISTGGSRYCVISWVMTNSGLYREKWPWMAGCAPYRALRLASLRLDVPQSLADLCLPASYRRSAPRRAARSGQWTGVCSRFFLSIHSAQSVWSGPLPVMPPLSFALTWNSVVCIKTEPTVIRAHILWMAASRQKHFGAAD